MKVCLLSPPYRSAVKSVVGVSSPPLGLAYLASVLREKHEVKIVDSNAFNYNMEDVGRRKNGAEKVLSRRCRHNKHHAVYSPSIQGGEISQAGKG